MTRVSYDSRAITIDGRRTFLLSGAIHYPRSTPGVWGEMMKRSVDAGLNTVETYVFWNLHERRRGVYDFADRLDLRRFCEIAAEHGLMVILRIGPYICAEINFGGFPAWLRDVPGIRFRTFNEPFMHEMERWVRFLAEYMKGLYAPEGGPIILAQIENEYGIIRRNYGEAGEKYAQWSIDLGLSLDLGIPWIMCVGGAPGAIETINGFYAHPHVGEHFAKHPDQPALWTENWPGWYDTWGSAHRLRSTEDVACGVARFVAAGGTGVNYYMWHGGTNFGREAMFLQTTSYDYSAPLDEFGLVTTKSKQLARLHAVLNAHGDVLVGNDPPKPRELGDAQCACVFGKGKNALVFLCNDDREKPATVSWEGAGWTLAPKSVVLVADGREVFRTDEVRRADVVRCGFKPSRIRLSPWLTWSEPLPAGRAQGDPRCVVAKKPVEQLALTHDESDYCWYRATMGVPRSGEGELRIRGAADIVHVFVDKKLIATSRVPPEDPRGSTVDRFNHAFRLKLKSGRHELALLCCAVGLIKGDWQAGGNMADEHKGLWGAVTWEGRKIGGPWTMLPGTVGESARLFDAGAAVVTWKPAKKGDARRPLRWLRTTFKRPKKHAPLAADLGTMTKGLAWLNGRCIGRYWLVEGQNDAPGWRGEIIHQVDVGKPTQRYYHLPTDWLADDNVLVLFEELGGDPAGVRIRERR